MASTAALAPEAVGGRVAAAGINANSSASASASASSSANSSSKDNAGAANDGSAAAAAASTPPSPPSANRAASIQHHTHRQNHNSSKLPAFRFADLKKDRLVALLQQHIPPSPVSPPNPAPPAGTASADLGPDPTAGATAGTTAGTAAHHNNPPHHQRGPSDHLPQHDSALQQPTSADPTTTASSSSSLRPASPPATSSSTSSSTHNSKNPSPIPGQSPTRAATFPKTSSTTAAAAAPSSASTSIRKSPKRPASFPESDAPVPTARLHRTLSDRNPSSTVARRPQQQRRSHGAESSSSSAAAATATRRSSLAATDGATKESPTQGQRELLLPKTLQDGRSSDDKRKSTSRPPVSFRPLRSDGPSPRAVIPPIRSFRSSGSRKSLVLDMNVRNAFNPYDDGDDISDPNHRDRTLRALEGRAADDEYLQMTPPDSAEATPDAENTADIFMRIAREDSTRRVADDDRPPVEEQITTSRVARSSHRRPLSAAVPSYQVTSPPRITRRLSDQRDNTRLRRFTDDHSAQQVARELASRTLTKDKAVVTPQKTETPRNRPISSIRPPITPRSAGFQDPSDAASAYAKRRPSLTDGSSAVPARNSSYKTSYGLPKNYNSSPLVPRNVEAHRMDYHEPSHGLEGTESSASTAAPSTVWDELDDLKSRMRRLELTGKIPPTSGAAMSRVSDDRPPTATTNATTISGSPKRTSGNGQAEAGSTTSSQREAQPILLAALSKAKPYVSNDVYSAIEQAAADALSLSQMVGVVGQPGPISSGASTIGTGAASTVTDRQLRRKAESICRSLTELCLALNDDGTAQKKTVQIATPRDNNEVPEPLMSPTLARAPTRFASAAAAADSGLTKLSTAAPRTATRLEDRRANLLNSPALPSPRYALAPNTPTDPVGRKSSLLISRTRRAGTEEPEDNLGRRTSLLRTRRAGTEEPDEGRKTSLLLRGRNKAMDEGEDDESRFRAPSRAVTEVAGLRPSPREYQAQVPAPDTTSLGQSALPRRRLVPSSLNSRLVAPSAAAAAAAAAGAGGAGAAAPGALAGRRFLERSTPERETSSVVEKLAEDRGPRQFSLGQTAMLNRTSSLTRRNRESVLPSNMSTTASQVGGYR